MWHIGSPYSYPIFYCTFYFFGNLATSTHMTDRKESKDEDNIVFLVTDQRNDLWKNRLNIVLL